METIGKAAGAAVTRSQQQSTVASSISSAQLAATAKHAKVLLGWCDRREVSDPEVFTDAIIAVLSDFPLDVQQRLVDPRSGILAKFENVWPFPERIRRACESVHGPQRWAREWDKGAKEQLAARAERERQMAEPRTDLKAKFGETYGIQVTKLPEPPNEGLKRMAHYSQQCIEREYRERGEEPVVSGGVVISRSLVEAVRAGSAMRVALGKAVEEDLGS